jgi:diguanylate cyclase (GGDEF)-like protein
MQNEFPVLIVEDDPVTRTLISKTLKKKGFGVVEADCGLNALEQFEKAFFPIVLTDWMMPETNGLELCRAIREKELIGYVFILILTSRGATDDIVSGLEAGADDYLTKPFNPSELIARINTAIRILKLEKSLRKANEEIRYLSITDPLTGCYNRGYLNERLNHEIKRARRHHHCLSIILADIDHFKRINDNFGHQAGDEVLKMFVETLQESIRDDVDWVVRYGGEEFLIILPETDSAGATSMAERLRKKTAVRKMKVEGRKIDITASFGGASLSSPEALEHATLEGFIMKADMMLYRSKEDGRNRVNMEEI